MVTFANLWNGYNSAMAYIYNDNNLVMICDFGGMAYKGLEGFPETEIGMDFKAYLMP